MSPARKWDADSLLAASYEMTKEADGTLHVACKAEKNDEPCPCAWDVDLEADGSMHKSVRTALVQHARAHNGGFSKMRRVAR
jgi:hypothetical protein